MSLTLLYVHLSGLYLFLSLTYFGRGITGLKPKVVDFFEAFIWEITIFGIIGGIIRGMMIKKAERLELESNIQELKQSLEQPLNIQEKQAIQKRLLQLQKELQEKDKSNGN